MPFFTKQAPNYTLTTMNCFAATINNPTQQHRDVLTLRSTGDGNCVLKERCIKLGGSWLVLVGDETAPTTGTRHLQVFF